MNEIQTKIIPKYAHTCLRWGGRWFWTMNMSEYAYKDKDNRELRLSWTEDTELMNSFIQRQTIEIYSQWVH